MGALYFYDFPWPATDTLNADVTRRETNTIWLKGLKVRREFQYRFDKGDANEIGPIEVHWGLVQLKNEEPDAEITADLTTDWFRDNSSTVAKARNFGTYATTDTWDQGMNVLAINPNKNVRVLTHKRRVIHPYHNATGMYTYNRHVWTIDKWYKVNKRMVFPNVTSNRPNQRLFEVFWFNTTTAKGFPVNNADGTFVDSIHHHKVYFCNQRGH